LEEESQLEFKEIYGKTIIKKFSKDIDLMRRSTHHGEKLKTNIQTIITLPKQSRNLHLQTIKVSATKSQISKCNK
jgi:hypothetical protein